MRFTSMGPEKWQAEGARLSGKWGADPMYPLIPMEFLRKLLYNARENRMKTAIHG
jgi:hypothetical protein